MVSRGSHKAFGKRSDSAKLLRDKDVATHRGTGVQEGGGDRGAERGSVVDLDSGSTEWETCRSARGDWILGRY